MPVKSGRRVAAFPAMMPVADSTIVEIITLADVTVRSNVSKEIVLLSLEVTYKGSRVL